MNLELFPGKHLFVDGNRIEETYGARRVLNQPEKDSANPVLKPEKPWETEGIHLCRVLYDRERRLFRAWYDSRASVVVGKRVLVTDNPPKNVYESQICYAESTDGITWMRPDLGIAEQERYPGNNICVPSNRQPGAGLLHQVIEDPFASDPAQRYKMIYLDQGAEGEVGDGLAPDAKLRLHAHSPDGIHWTRCPAASAQVSRLFSVISYLQEAPSGPIDPDAPYILYGQRGSQWKTRQIGRRDSNDFIHWSNNRPILESRLEDVPTGLEFYYLEGAGINQTYAGLHLGMLGTYHTDLRRKFDPARNDGLTECQLAYSRDTVRWERWGTPFLTRGDPGSCDWGGVYCTYPAFTDDLMCFMYGSESSRHGKKSNATVCLATMRLDGFVSVETEGYMEGVLTTRPHMWKAREVGLNVQSQNGGVRVQLQDETGRACDGFSADECDPIREDALHKVVTWGRSGADVRSLQDKMVALKFIISPEDKLYSYTLQPLDT